MSEYNEELLLEKLAALEHEQWIEWAKDLIDKGNVDKERADNWEEKMIPYIELSEEDKEMDREFARKVIDVLGESNEEEKEV